MQTESTGHERQGLTMSACLSYQLLVNQAMETITYPLPNSTTDLTISQEGLQQDEVSIIAMCTKDGRGFYSNLMDQGTHKAQISDYHLPILNR